MTTEEWWSLEEIARLTIYFNMMKELTTFALWEKLQISYEKKWRSSKLILLWQLFKMKMRETKLATFVINIFSQVLTEISIQSLNFEEEVLTS